MRLESGSRVVIQINKDTPPLIEIDGNDITSSVNRAALILEDGRTPRLTVDFEIDELDNEVIAELTTGGPSIEEIKEYIKNFLSQVDAKALEDKVLNETGWDSKSPVAAALDALKEIVDGIHS